MRDWIRMGVCVVAFFLFCILLLPGIAAARMEYSLGDNRRLLVEGTLWSQTLLRSDDFKLSRQFDPVSLRNNLMLELTVENLLTNWGFIDRVDLHAKIRPVYEAIYDIRNNEFGDEGPAFSRPYRHGGPRGPGFPGFQFLPDGTPLHPAGTLEPNVPRRPNRKHPIFNFFPGTPWANGRVVLRGSEVGFTNFENTENNMKWDHTNSNDENELREFYFDITAGRHWLRLGRQIVSWGKTDYFRSQDIVNPVDFGWHSFYEPWEDILIPQWMVQYQYQLGAIGPFDNVALELVWNVDDFQPNSLGQQGSPWAHPFANQVAWFSIFGSVANDFFPDPNDPSQLRYNPIGTVRMAHPSWSLSNTEGGFRLSARYKGWYFALTNWYGWDDNPNFYADRVFNPNHPVPLIYWGTVQALQGSGLSAAEIDQTARLFGSIGTNFDAEYYHNNTTGLSADYFWDWAKTVVRLESSYTNKVLVGFIPNETAGYGPIVDVGEFNMPIDGQRAYKRARKILWAIGLDRPTYMFWLDPDQTVFLSAQTIATQILNWEGGAHWGHVVPRTEIIQTASATWHWYRDRIIPQVWMAYLPTPKVNAWTGGANVEWLITNHWSMKAGLIFISGGYNRHNPGQPIWPFVMGPTWLTNQEGPHNPALGRAVATNPAYGLVKDNFAAYRDRDEVFFKFQYRF